MLKVESKMVTLNWWPSTHFPDVKLWKLCVPLYCCKTLFTFVTMSSEKKQMYCGNIMEQNFRFQSDITITIMTNKHILRVCCYCPWYWPLSSFAIATMFTYWETKWQSYDEDSRMGTCNSDTKYSERLINGFSFLPVLKAFSNRQKSFKWIRRNVWQFHICGRHVCC